MTRLIILIILLLLSLLTVLRAQAYFLWLTAIVVSEFPLIFVAATLIVLCIGFWVSKYQLSGTIVGCIALILFLSPIFRSYQVSGHIKQDIIGAFGQSSMGDDISPFNFADFFKFKYNGTVKYQTLTYATYTDGASLSLDYYPSQIIGKRPCIIVVHGGSWSSGDSRQLPELNSYLAKKGYNVASINYRLAPRYQNPASVEDIKNTLLYLRQHADELHIDTTNFVLLGRSAGAQIALLAAYNLHDKGLKGVIDFYGPADMVWGYSIPSNPLIMDSRHVMEDYVGGTYAKVPEKYAASSPILFVNKSAVPTLIIHGANDVLVSYIHSEKLDEKLKENNVKHYWLQLPWATHGFDFNLYGPGGQLSTYAVEQFLNTVTH